MYTIEGDNTSIMDAMREAGADLFGVSVMVAPKLWTGKLPSVASATSIANAFDGAEALEVGECFTVCVDGNVKQGDYASAEDAVKYILDHESTTRMNDFITRLALVPHPEGGYFREVYRSGAPVMESGGRTDERGEVMETPVGMRNQFTSMFWMANNDAPILKMGCNVSMHIHYYNGGNAFKYWLISPNKIVTEVVLGPDATKGHVQQMIVPSNTFKFGLLMPPEADFLQGSNRFVLVSEAVVPGFDFGDFSWVTTDMLASRVTPEDFNRFSGFLYDSPKDRDFFRFYKTTLAATGTEVGATYTL